VQRPTARRDAAVGAKRAQCPVPVGAVATGDPEPRTQVAFVQRRLPQSGGRSECQKRCDQRILSIRSQYSESVFDAVLAWYSAGADAVTDDRKRVRRCARGEA